MSESRPPGRPLDARREAALLDAALELLSEVGYERLSLTEVCRRAGASTKTVYRRWTNKDELMTAALRRAVVRAVDEPFEVVATGSLRGDLLENLRASARTQRQFTPQYMAGLLVAASSGSDAGRMARELFRVHYARHRKALTCSRSLSRDLAHPSTTSRDRTPRPCRHIPVCLATPCTLPHSRLRSEREGPHRRTGHTPKYVQYEGVCPARREHAPTRTSAAAAAGAGQPSE
ncbi:TetR/AcrR family transcriptional regulator [Streptomyces capitiformicae]|uniref:TetR/AcrR family transcriptional regulator n=1 Tax=Streptomyces capitiformicae TaxID=2014920 RepID=UPI001AD83CB1|nr:TetR/AcrR family transcriptional regulator [Streptomyces capitiformicae]